MVLMWWTMGLMALASVLMAVRWMIVRRRSAFVAAWRNPSREDLRQGRVLGGLFVRTAGDGDTVYLLLHGLGATGLTWGAGVEELADHGVLFMPDLLGWGGSLDMERTSFTLDDHMAALDNALQEAGLSSHRLVIGGHSMGAMLALCYAARHIDRVDRVVTWGAPTYTDIRTTIKNIGWMPRLFAMDAKPAQVACRIMCAQRNAAAHMAVASRPDVPAPLAAASVEHTWPSYRGSLRALVVDNDWREPLAQLDDAGIPVEMQWGANDKIGNPADVEAWAVGRRWIRIVRVPEHDHHLPFVVAHSAVVESLLADSDGGRRSL